MTTWADVQIGDTVFDKKGKLWRVTAERDGWLRIDNGKAIHNLRRPPDDHEVEMYRPTEQEAINLAIEELGGRILRMIGERERSIRRAQTWQVEPVTRKANAIRDHIDWFHACNVDDVLRRHDGTKANPSSTARKRAALAELVEAHDYLHDNPDAFPMNKPHVHVLTPKEPS